MLAILGLVTILLLLVLVISKKASPVVALIVVPVITALLGGFTTEIADFITEGIKTISTTAVMFVFAILFFGVLMDAGTFNPIITRLLRIAGNDPVRIAIVTAILAMLVHLDGSGAVTFLITVPAMVSVYDKLGMKRSTLATIVALSAGTMNILPWGGPTIRAATALNVPVMELFLPMSIPLMAGLLTVLAIAYVMGLKERKNISWTHGMLIGMPERVKYAKLSLRESLVWYANILLIVVAITVMIAAWLPPHVIFMLAFTVALCINYSNVNKQREKIEDHAKSALLMASILFAAGCFIGILQGSGMINAMATAGLNYIPDVIGNNLALATGLVSMPASLLFDPDSFYFGILPVLATTAEHFNGSAIEVGRAAISGQMTTGFPISPLTGSTFLLIGLADVDLGDHQRKTIPLAFLVTLVILLVSVLVGAINI
ncbi:citrate:proton symporter [Albibacterium sp.]|uniref:CitMHS family transporter n=1 Tax=Albibacterium sp. TaxID=2952885 RepID=UPI002BC4501C|nr:citrate:proton symporter [Albibacterium sp.]HUH18878.1 citrate:proton symporter [Albibacterium sp.]